MGYDEGWFAQSPSVAAMSGRMKVHSCDKDGVASLFADTMVSTRD